MKKITQLKFYDGSKEEDLPDFSYDFPYICSRAELDHYIGRFVPWHWHKALELFYIESGELIYYTPHKKIVFPAGSGGIVNTNVLHMTKPKENVNNTIQLLHIFDISFLCGEKGTFIDKKYFTPFITASQLEILPIFQNVPEHFEILKLLQESFKISTDEYVYELKLRAKLCEIWSEILKISGCHLDNEKNFNRNDDKIKIMMTYIHENYSQKTTIAEIASSAFISERECYRTFQKCLHTTPLDYLRTYRLQKACHMLLNTQKPITSICYKCGLGNSSYFGKIFRKYIGCTPSQYRKYWQENGIVWHK